MSGTEEERELALAALQGRVAALGRLLRHEWRTVQSDAVDRLRSVGSEEAAAALEEVVENPLLEGQVYDALVRLAFERSVPVFVRGLSHTDKSIRCLSANGLARSRASDRAEKIIPLLDDPATRRAAIQALGDLRAGAAAERIRPFLGNLDLRKDAIRALGRMKDESIESYLRDRADDLDPAVREACLVALVRLGRKDLPEIPSSAEGRVEWAFCVRPEMGRRLCPTALRRR